MNSEFDHIFLIGFGGPETPDEVMPFLRRVTAGRNIPDARLALVAKHYDAIGGQSPYNAWAGLLQNQIRELNKTGLPLFLGYRNTAPFLSDQVLEIHRQGLKKGIGVILSPFRSPTGCRRYKENIREALHEHGITNLEYRYLEPWYRHPKLIRLLADLIKPVYDSIPKDVRSETEILFSCHSIPLMMEKECSSCIYSAEYEACATLTAAAAGLTSWKHVYQSRSGNPAQPWLEPDILDAVTQSAASGKKAVMVIPLGFLSDNAEVLYDLDIEAKKAAETAGLKFYRAPTPGNDPRLAELIAEMIAETVKDTGIPTGCLV